MAASHHHATHISRPIAHHIRGRNSPGPPRFVAHLLRCKIGRAVWGIDDLSWARALLYGRQLLDCFVGEVIVLTPHGWTTGPSRGALAPTLGDLERRRAV